MLIRVWDISINCSEHWLVRIGSTLWVSINRVCDLRNNNHFCLSWHFEGEITGLAGSFYLTSWKHTEFETFSVIKPTKSIMRPNINFDARLKTIQSSLYDSYSSEKQCNLKQSLDLIKQLSVFWSSL